jgi:hypothetical protein
MVFTTIAGKPISGQTVSALRDLYRQSHGEFLTGRLWREILSNEERLALGGSFAAAFRAAPGVGEMYHRVYPGLSAERALLESMRLLGWLAQPKYELLVDGIGEHRTLPPSRGGKPLWDGKTLFLNCEAIRTFRQPKKAKRLTAILDAFHRHGWPHELGREKIGKYSARELSDALRRLRKGLDRITIEMNGAGTGVLWRPV